jgi:hypothetical protein
MSQISKALTPDRIFGRDNTAGDAHRQAVEKVASILEVNGGKVTAIN